MDNWFLNRVRRKKREGGGESREPSKSSLYGKGARTEKNIKDKKSPQKRGKEEKKQPHILQRSSRSEGKCY